LKILAAASFICGFGLIVLTVYPILSYEVFSKNKYPDLISPVPEGETSNSKTDYTKASTWFVGDDKSEFNKSKISFYTITIPKLDIENATVAIGGDDLSKSLIQYPGTALPGKNGNAVIFGHSILPQFYNPDDYMAIFSTLSSLNKGDEITIYFDGVTYLYRVYSIFEVKPTDIQVLEQDKSDSFISLVTCTPPGDPRNPRRLIVKARVIPPDISYANSGN